VTPNKQKSPSTAQDEGGQLVVPPAFAAGCIRRNALLWR
jgi:hypothetical protein